MSMIASTFWKPMQNALLVTSTHASATSGHDGFTMVFASLSSARLQLVAPFKAY